MFTIDIVITYVTVRNQTIMAIHFNTVFDLQGARKARVNVRGAGCKGEDQEQG